MRLIALLALSGIAAVLGFGYLGRFHMAFDSLAHFRVHFAVLAIAMALPMLLMRFRMEAAFAALLGIAAIAQTSGVPLLDRLGAGQAAAVPDQPAAVAVYRLMQLNLRYDNTSPEAVLSLVGRVKPDVVTFNEVSRQWVDRLAVLESAYPYRMICEEPSLVGGVAVLSRRPFAEGDETATCLDRGALARVKLDIGGRSVEVVAMHLGWPWPFEQPWQLPRVAKLLAGVGDTAVVAGDLNATPWSRAARTVAEAADARLVRGIGPTWLDRRLPAWLRPLIGLPIDNVMVKGGVLPVSVTTLEAVGSDHLPVLLEFLLLPEEEPASVLQAASGE